MTGKARSTAETVSKAQAAARDAFDDARRVAGALRSAGQDLAAEQLMARVAAAVRRELGALVALTHASDVRTGGDASERAGEQVGASAPASAGARVRKSWRRGGSV